MSSPLESVGDFLVTQGLGTLGTDLFLGLMPTSPDLCVAVYEGSSGLPIETFGATVASVEISRIQVIVRGPRDDYPTARNRALLIRTALGSIVNQTISGLTLSRVSADTWVMPMGKDDLDRPKFSTQFRVHAEP